MVHALHRVPPPRGIPVWTPLVPPSLPDDLATLAADAWDTGPFGEEARSALRGRLPEVTRWTADYHRLAERAGEGPGANPALLAMFDLEWRLDEIAQYADWFARPHLGTASDTVALAGLRTELDRPG